MQVHRLCYAFVFKKKWSSTVLRNFLLSIMFFIIFLIIFFPQKEKNTSLNSKNLRQSQSIYGAIFFSFDRKGMFLTFPFLEEISSFVERIHTPLAHIASNEFLVIESNKGIYEKNRMLLELESQVDIFSSTGYHIRTGSVRVDTENGEAFGENPVAGYSAFGAMSSDGLCVFDRGRAVVFMGRSRLFLYPSPAAIHSKSCEMFWLFCDF